MSLSLNMGKTVSSKLDRRIKYTKLQENRHLLSRKNLVSFSNSFLYIQKTRSLNSKDQLLGIGFPPSFSTTLFFLYCHPDFTLIFFTR